MREIQALDPTVDPDQTIRHFLFWPLGQSQGSGGAHQPNAAPALKLTAAATQTAAFGIAPTGHPNHRRTHLGLVGHANEPSTALSRLGKATTQARRRLSSDD